MCNIIAISGGCQEENRVFRFFMCNPVFGLSFAMIISEYPKQICADDNNLTVTQTVTFCYTKFIQRR